MIVLLNVLVRYARKALVKDRLSQPMVVLVQVVQIYALQTMIVLHPNQLPPQHPDQLPPQHPSQLPLIKTVVPLKKDGNLRTVPAVSMRFTVPLVILVKEFIRGLPMGIMIIVATKTQNVLNSF